MAGNNNKNNNKNCGRGGGILKLKIRGKRLKNMDTGFSLHSIKTAGSIFNLSDPFFEVIGSHGEKTYTSEIVKNNLNPNWKLAELDVNALCGGDLDVPIQIVVLDDDKNGKFDMIGVSVLSVNKLLSNNTRAFDVMNEGEKTGEITIDYVILSKGIEKRHSKQTLQEQQINKQRKKQEQQIEARNAQEKADQLKSIANEKLIKANELEQQLKEAEMKSNELNESVKKAKEYAKSKPCSGTIKFKLRGTKLPNLDGLFGKSDPFFEVIGASGSILYTSEVINDNLNPEWNITSDIDICDLTHGMLDVPNRIKFYDKDPNKNDYMGQISICIKDLIIGGEENTMRNGNCNISSRTTSCANKGIRLVKGLDELKKGTIYIDEIIITNYVDYNTVAMEAKKLYDDYRIEYYTISKEHQKALNESSIAHDNATKAQQEADTLLASLSE